MCTNDTEKASLENLKCDLQEILDLTQETLNEMKGTSNSCEDVNEEDPYAQEMAIFMAEINKCESSTSKTNDTAKEHMNGEMEKFKVMKAINEGYMNYETINFFSFEFRMKLNQLSGKSVQLRIHLHGEHVVITMRWFVAWNLMLI